MAAGSRHKYLLLLMILGMMDGWKIVLTLRNIANVIFSPAAEPEQMALNAIVNGEKNAKRVVRFTAISTCIEFCVIVFVSLDRIYRIVFDVNARAWNRAAEKSEDPFIPYVVYVLFYSILPALVFRGLSVAPLDGRYVRRYMALLEDGVEMIFVTGWLLILHYLARRVFIPRTLIFLVGVIASLEEYLFRWFCLKYDVATSEKYIYNEVTSKLVERWHAPPDIVRVPGRDNWEVKHVGRIGYDVILMDRNILTEVSDIENIGALLGLELGQWYYGMAIKYAIPILRTVALAWLLAASYDSPIVADMFGFSEKLDPVVPMLMAYAWLWPPILDIIKYIDCLGSYWTVIQGDHVASKFHPEPNLKAALNLVCGVTEHSPDFDGWYSAWILGRPTVRSRIQNTEIRMTKKGWSILRS